MPRLTVACMARNEAGRFWRSALEAWSTFADGGIFILDDGSTDRTRKIAARCRSAYFIGSYTKGEAWGAEAQKRKELWDYVMSEVPVGAYVLWLDADMVPARDPRPLLEAEPDAVAFGLYDLWGEDAEGRLLYRADGAWRAHAHPRIWLIRRPETPPEGWLWNQRGVHCGHLPVNFQPHKVLLAPREYSLLHYAYSAPDLREAKAAAYESVADQLSDFERAHARSILDREPVLFRVPFEAELRLERTAWTQ